MNDLVLKNMLEKAKPLLKRRLPLRYQTQRGLDIYAEHTYKPMWAVDTTSNGTFDANTYHVPKDGRRNKMIIWVYNSRMLTVSFAILLHELGHHYGEQTSWTKEGERHNQDWGFGNVEDELLAWDWAISKWDLVPLRTSFPYWYMCACLSSYFDAYDEEGPNTWSIFRDIKQQIDDAKEKTGTPQGFEEQTQTQTNTKFGYPANFSL